MSDSISSNSWVKKTLHDAAQSNFELSNKKTIKLGAKCTSVFSRIYNFFTMNAWTRKYHYYTHGNEILKKSAAAYSHEALEKLPPMNWVRAVAKNSRLPPIAVARSIQNLANVEQSKELKEKLSNFIRTVLSNIYPDLPDLQCLELLPKIFDKYEPSTDKKMGLYNLAETLVGRYLLTELRSNEGSQLPESVWARIESAISENNVKIHSKNGLLKIHALIIGVETNLALLSQSDEKVRLLNELRSKSLESEIQDVKENQKPVSEMNESEILQELQDYIVNTSLELFKNDKKNDYRILTVVQEPIVDDEEMFDDEQVINEKPNICWSK